MRLRQESAATHLSLPPFHRKASCPLLRHRARSRPSSDPQSMSLPVKARGAANLTFHQNGRLPNLSFGGDDAPCHPWRSAQSNQSGTAERSPSRTCHLHRLSTTKSGLRAAATDASPRTTGLQSVEIQFIVGPVAAMAIPHAGAQAAHRSSHLSPMLRPYTTASLFHHCRTPPTRLPRPPPLGESVSCRRRNPAKEAEWVTPWATAMSLGALISAQ